jgi:hypothetical protein
LKGVFRFSDAKLVTFFESTKLHAKFLSKTGKNRPQAGRDGAGTGPEQAL